MEWFERLSRLDRRWIYLILATVVIITIIVEFQPPIRINPEVKSIYDFVESRKPGSYVHLAVDYDPGSQAEMHPMTYAIMEQVLAKDIKIIMYTVMSEEKVPLAIRKMADAFIHKGPTALYHLVEEVLRLLAE